MATMVTALIPMEPERKPDMLAVVEENIEEGPMVLFRSADDQQVEQVFVNRVNKVFGSLAENALQAEEIADQNSWQPVKLYLTSI